MLLALLSLTFVIVFLNNYKSLLYLKHYFTRSEKILNLGECPLFVLQWDFMSRFSKITMNNLGYSGQVPFFHCSFFEKVICPRGTQPGLYSYVQCTDYTKNPATNIVAFSPCKGLQSCFLDDSKKKHQVAYDKKQVI